MIVFVYGTLKRGFGNNRLIQHAIDRKGAKFLAEATSIRPVYHMFDTGGFPVLIETNKPDGGTVFGELYEVDDACMRSMDGLEANGRMYQRAQQEFVSDDEVYNAWVYLGMPQAFNYERMPRVLPNDNGVLNYAHAPQR